MDTRVHDLLRRLAAVAPLEVPAGEVGVAMQDESGALRQYLPVLSVYLDLRPLAGGERPAVHPARVVLRERLHQITQTFAPRGHAYDTVRADAARIEAYLDHAVAPATRGIAIFAGTAHQLFETLATDAPFENRISARPTPDLFQLAHLLDDQDVAVVAVAHTNAVRLFVTHRGGLREVRGLADDPKFYHQVRQVNAMNQAHYQRHAQHVRAEFAREAAERITELVERTGAGDVILGGDAEAVPLLRQALSPQLAGSVREPPHGLALEAPRASVWEDVEPLLLQAQADRGRAWVERLVEAVQADALGVAGITPTQAALERGQADVLIMANDVPLAPDVRSALIAQATKTDAMVEIVDQSEPLTRLGGVGALLRYR